jgi:predicted  nucleic acid-binding Zn-ribbon protein
MDVKPILVQTLHRILRQKTDLESQLARGPRRIQFSRNAETDAQHQLEVAQQELKRLKLLAADRQLQLKQRETKLEDLKSKRNMCSSNREYSLLNDQIAADQQANTVLADEILDTLDSIDKQTEAQTALQKRLAECKQETVNVQKDVEAKAQQLQQELSRVVEELRACEKDLPGEVRGEFQNRIKSKGEEALAVVDDGSCGNCHQILTAHMLDQLSMGRIHICAGCNSILYVGEGVSV